MTYAGVVTLLEKQEWPDVRRNYTMVWMGACGLKQNLGGIKAIAP